MTTTSTHLWVVVIEEVQVDPQLPHALKRISEPQTDNKNPKKTNSVQVQTSCLDPSTEDLQDTTLTHPTSS